VGQGRNKTAGGGSINESEDAERLLPEEGGKSHRECGTGETLLHFFLFGKIEILFMCTLRTKSH
jgi:hypothetical protein